ncbi:FAD/NAD(P)-binding domain-containing protein [Cystobasidium minutum MCA 4210]|uniref:FAD/NAD(P)-binding domain-containing protein n=1 Tax=Cystobasidium minutum MCA 4210 TaxID=1397322 RepID=UPI0034CE0C7A|eukprot:jgi/Rhomi1/82788/CE82787_1142
MPSVIIIGAGLAGLAAAISIQNADFQVTVLESTKELTEVGAGLQITPQSIRSFKKWGIAERLEPLAANPKTFTIHRYSDGKVLAHEADWRGWQEENFGSGVWDLHRADLQKALFDRANELGVKFEFGVRIKGVDCENGAVSLADGTEYKADLVVCADGLHSVGREAIVGRADPPLPTGDLAYRIVLNKSHFNDPDLEAYMAKPAVRLYAGPKAHVIMYSLKGGQEYNIVLLVPDDLPPDVRRAEGDTDEMMALFEGWDPILRKFLSMVTKVDKWRLMHHKGLDSWFHPSGRVVLVGDSCHPMLPYLAAGSNSAMEDGVVLGECLKRAKTKENILAALKVYEKIRKPRSDEVVALTHQQRHWNHLDDGEEQQQRDQLMQQVGVRSPDMPSAWVNSKLWGFLCGYNPWADVEEKWDTLYNEAKTGQS